MPTKVAYIASDVNKVLAFEWIIQYIDSSKIELSFILINSEDTDIAQFLQQHNIPTYFISCPSKKEAIKGVYECYKIVRKIKPDVVHCHLIMANLIGLTAAKLAGIKKRIYTRHHSDYHQVYFPNAVKWDKYCNRMATKIISISDNVTHVLTEQEGVSINKIEKIRHGFEINGFINRNEQQVKLLQEKYNPMLKRPVIGVISRFFHLKGIQYIIPAYQQFLKEYPNALLLFFNARGDYEKELDTLLAQLPKTSYQKVPFEKDIANLYGIFDAFIHVPISPSVEAFGQTYVEVMLAGVPLIATKSGIGNEIMKDKENCLEVPYKNSEAITEALLNLLENKELTDKLTSNALNTVKDEFTVEKMIEKLEKVYLE